MVYVNREFPAVSTSERFQNPLRSGVLQSPGVRLEIEGVEEIYSGSLNYLEFISLVKKVWEESHPLIPILPTGINRESFSSFTDVDSEDEIGNITSVPEPMSADVFDEYPAIIGYSLELRKSHTMEPKPRMRQNVMSNSITVYGQKFQNIIAFTVMSKANTLQGDNPKSVKDDLDTAILCDQIIESFEDFMLEYTPIFKAAGASDLVYSRRLSDSEVNRKNKNIHKRTVTYMLTTEKTFAIKNERIEKIRIDIRTWLGSRSTDTRELATPNYEDVEVQIIDLDQSTPNI
jgi:hypothetical protein